MNGEKKFQLPVPEPDVLNGLGVNWDTYVPGGGWEWQINFRDTFVPKLQEVRKFAVDELSKFITADNVFCDVKRETERVVKYFENLKDVMSKYENFGIAITSDPFISNFIGQSDSMMRVLRGKVNSFTMDNSYISRCNTDIQFIDAVISYFQNDLCLDMVFWALWMIPVKYRTKTFRTAVKVLKSVLEAKNIVDTSTSQIADRVRQMLSQPLRELAKAYAEFPTLIKAHKKMLDKEGDMFWMHYGVDDFKFRQEIAASAGKWDVCNFQI